MKRVLLIKVWAIGEYLMATPAFDAIREVYAGAEITLLTGSALAPLARTAAFCDRVWTVPEVTFVRRKLPQLAALRNHIRRESFDLAFVFHHAREFAIFAAAAGVRHRIGFDREGDGFAHTVKVPYGVRTHQVEEYFDLARAGGAGGEPGLMTVEVNDDAREEAAAACLATPLEHAGRPYVILAPGGGVNVKTKMVVKRWPAEYYGDLLRDLGREYSTVLVGTPSDESVTAPLAPLATADLTGKLSLPALYVLLQRARCFIGNDSAPMHLAAAAQTPTVAFFGPTNPALNGPWHAPTLILTNPQPCQPCYKDGYFPDCADAECLTALTPARAVAAIHEFLDTIPARC